MRFLRRIINVFRNEVYIINGNKVKRKFIPFIKGLKIEFDRNGNKIYIDKNTKFRKSLIHLSCHNAEIRLGSGLYSSTIINCKCGDNQKLIIKDGFTSVGTTFQLNETNASVEIEENCMFSNDIVFWATDGHAIFNLGDNFAYNTPKTIKIGKHVWIGNGAKLTKGAVIPNDSIVALGSVVSKDFSQESNIIIAGNPARIVKHNINWNRDKTPTNYNCF